MKKALSERVAELEKRMALIETKPPVSRKKAAWQKHVGWAKDDPLYDQALQLGARYRRGLK